ncbi:MAG: hypothetical protein ACRDR6_05605 [Pseudonocardiaceae bacterium]
MIPGTMTVWFVAVVPVLIMFFALAMERLENRLRHLTVQENDVEEFLQAARPEEVRVLFGSGIDGALEAFQRRRLPDTGSPAGNPPEGRNGASPHDEGLVASQHGQQRL